MLKKMAAPLLAVLLGACYAEDPIDPEPRVRVDRALLGTWICRADPPEKTDEPLEMTIEAAGERVYAVALKEPDDEPERYRAWASDVDGTRLFNVAAADEETPLRPKPWVFVKAELDDGELRVAVMDGEVLLRAHPAGNIRRAVSRVAASDEAYESFCVCRRETTPAP